MTNFFHHLIEVTRHHGSEGNEAIISRAIESFTPPEFVWETDDVGGNLHHISGKIHIWESGDIPGTFTISPAKGPMQKGFPSLEAAKTAAARHAFGEWLKGGLQP